VVMIMVSVIGLKGRVIFCMKFLWWVLLGVVFVGVNLVRVVKMRSINFIW